MGAFVSYAAIAHHPLRSPVVGSAYRLRLLALGGLSFALGGCFLLFDFDHYEVTDPAGLFVEGDGAVNGTLIKLGAIAPVVVQAGTTARITIALERRGYRGAVRVRVSTPLPANVSVSSDSGTGDALIPVDGTSTEIAFTASAVAAAGSVSITVVATAEPAPGDPPSLARDEGVTTLTVTRTGEDPSFGDGGLALGTTGEILQDVAVGKQGRVLVMAYHLVQQTGQIDPSGMMVLYREEGSTFTRIAEADVTAPANDCASHLRMAIESDGTVVCADNCRERLLALHSDGGVAWQKPVAGLRSPIRLLATSDDKLVLVEQAFIKGGAVDIRRFDALGAVDTSFGDAGISRTPALSPADAVLTGDAHVVVCANVVVPSKAVVLRFNANGSADATFGAQGSVELIGSRACFGAVPDAPNAAGDGLLVAANDPTDTGQVLRLRQDGARDTTFANGGEARLDGIGAMRPTAIAKDKAAGTIYVGGDLGPAASPRAFVVGKTANGAPHPSLTIDGGARLLPGTEVGRMLVLPDGRLVVAGNTKDTWFVARLLP